MPPKILKTQKTTVSNLLYLPKSIYDGSTANVEPS